MKQVPLSHLASVSAGQGAPKDNEFSDSGIPFVRAGSLEPLLSGKPESELELVSEETAKQRRLKTYPKGTILFAKSGMSATKDRIYALQNPAHVVSHLATLIPKNGTHADYLRLALKHFPPSSLIKDPAYPSISLGEIESFEISLPENFNDQIRIAHLLGKTEGLITQRKQHLKQLNDLLKSVFLEMFGDPVRNEKGWDKPPLRAFGEVSTGNTPPRNNPANYEGSYIEWIKTDNIATDAMFVTMAAEHLSEAGAKRARTVGAGALLVACIAGSAKSIGRAALTDRKVAFNQQINAIQPGADIDPIFLHALFKLSGAYIRSHASKGMKKILAKGDFEQIHMVRPPLDLQHEFAVVARRIGTLASRYRHTLADLEILYTALSQSAFNGELDLSRIPLPAITLEPEPMEDTATITVDLDVPASPLPDLGLAAAELANEANQLTLLTAWLETWNAQLGGRAFVLADFLDAAQSRLQDLYPNDDLELGMAAYEQVKGWVFGALDRGALAQGYDEETKRITLKAAHA
jgi:type I restriction enzyme S subunit